MKPDMAPSEPTPVASPAPVAAPVAAPAVAPAQAPPSAPGAAPASTSADLGWDGDTDGLPEEARRAARIGLWALGLALGGFLLWATLAPLDEGVPSPGVVVIDTKRKPVQHLVGGIVKEVLVREGERVQTGQLLMRMDDAVARANFEAVRQRYLSLRATQARLQAELAGPTAPLVLHEDLQTARQDPLIQQQIATQTQLLDARRAGLAADLRTLEEGVRGQQATLQSQQGMRSSRLRQLALLSEELGQTRGLVSEGYAPRNRQLELERMVAESSTAIEELQGSSERARHGIEELRQRMQSRQKAYAQEVQTQLAEVTRDVLADEVRFRALQEELERTQLKSPTHGQVLGLAFQAPGSVVQPGQKLMDVVPDNEGLLLEARIAPFLVDRVQRGLPVDIRFSAFAHTPQLVVGGEVTSVSSDLVVDPQTNASYYLARVQVTPAGLKALGRHQLQAGMPAEVVLRTGERTLLTYLLHPLSKRLAAAMKEE